MSNIELTPAAAPPVPNHDAPGASTIASSRYELLPFGAGPEQAATLPEPVSLTVTCSPRHGLDRTIEVAETLRGHGHAIIPHIPAKMVRDRRHLNKVLKRIEAVGIDEIFLVGGDAPEPLGPFESAVELLPEIDQHALRPERIGIGGYPEGHPHVEPHQLREALFEKGKLADYFVTQMCFDPDLLVDWISGVRDDGLELPVYIGIPGAVERRKLLEISMRVGVGRSVSFLSKQKGIRRLMGSPKQAVNSLYEALAPRVGRDELGIAGFHWYTFNRVQETWAWEQDHDAWRQPLP